MYVPSTLERSVKIEEILRNTDQHKINRETLSQETKKSRKQLLTLVVNIALVGLAEDQGFLPGIYLLAHKQL